MIEDKTIWPALLELAGCLETEFEGEDLCFLGVLGGQQVPWDYGEKGMVWVRMGSVYQSTQFPDQDQGPGCAKPLAFDVEVGALRCAPVPKGRPPTLPGVAEHEEAARIQVRDMRSMLHAIQCCFKAQLRTREVVVGTYNPVGPAGGVLGGVWELTVSEEF